jgi:polysaccharide deacetylase 2 family uncharacterized protein YibQ
MTLPPTVTDARLALEEHDQREAKRRASEDAQRAELARALRRAEEAEQRAAQVAGQVAWAEHQEGIAAGLGAAITAREEALAAVDGELARLRRQAADLATAENAANADAGRLLAAGDIDAATTAGGRVLDLQATQRVIAVQIEQADQRRQAVVVGSGANDALSDLRREWQNAVSTAASCRREAERIGSGEVDAPPAPFVRPVPDMLTIPQRRRIERDLDRARRAGVPAVIVDGGRRLA